MQTQYGGNSIFVSTLNADLHWQSSELQTLAILLMFPEKERQTDRQRQADRQTDRQTETETDKETDSERASERERERERKFTCQRKNAPCEHVHAKYCLLKSVMALTKTDRQ